LYGCCPYKVDKNEGRVQDCINAGWRLVPQRDQADGALGYAAVTHGGLRRQFLLYAATPNAPST
jgi:hypothetical protein